VDVIGLLALLSASSVASVGFRFRLLCSRNSSMDGDAIIVILAVSSLAVLSLRAVVKSRCTLYTVSLNNFVNFLVSSLLYVKVAHFVFRCCGLVSVFCF
jgi:hypothetical protein